MKKKVNKDLKDVLSTRCSAALKDKIFRKADDLDVSASELAESMLANYLANYEIQNETETLDVSFENADAAAGVISDLQDANNKLHDENDVLRKQNEGLNQENSVLLEQTAHLSDPVFLKLFEQFKGRTEQILTSSGEIISITYNTESDLLKAMIYTVIYKP